MDAIKLQPIGTIETASVGGVRIVLAPPFRAGLY